MAVVLIGGLHLISPIIEDQDILPFDDVFPNQGLFEGFDSVFLVIITIAGFDSAVPLDHRPFSLSSGGVIFVVFAPTLFLSGIFGSDCLALLTGPVIDKLTSQHLSWL